jgi:hypothetical protein
MTYTENLEKHVEKLQQELHQAHSLIHRMELRDNRLRSSSMYLPYRIVITHKNEQEDDTFDEYHCLSHIKAVHTFISLLKPKEINSIVEMKITRFGLFHDLRLYYLAYPFYTKVDSIREHNNNTIFISYNPNENIFPSSATKYFTLKKFEATTPATDRIRWLRSTIESRYPSCASISG